MCARKRPGLAVTYPRLRCHISMISPACGAPSQGRFGQIGKKGWVGRAGPPRAPAQIGTEFRNVARSSLAPGGLGGPARPTQPFRFCYTCPKTDKIFCIFSKKQCLHFLFFLKRRTKNLSSVLLPAS